MTKRDLAVRVARKTKVRQQDVLQIVQLCLDTLTDELAAGRSIEFRNFGVFELTVRKPRIGRNPNAPQNTVQIPERVTVKFKPGKKMKEKVSRLKPSDIVD